MTFVLPELAPQLPMAVFTGTTALVAGLLMLVAILLGAVLALYVIRNLPPDSTFSVRLGPSGVRLGMARGVPGTDDDGSGATVPPPVPASWQEFVQKNHDALLKDTTTVCLGVGVPRDRIADVYQEAVTGLATSWRRARNADAGPRAFMRGIISKKALDVKYGRTRADSFNAEAEPLPDNDADEPHTSTGAEERALRVLQIEELLRAVRQLPRQQRQVVYLIDLLGYSIEETAGELNITPHAVRQAHYKAKQKLRRRFNTDR